MIDFGLGPLVQWLARDPVGALCCLSLLSAVWLSFGLMGVRILAWVVLDADD